MPAPNAMLRALLAGGLLAALAACASPDPDAVPAAHPGPLPPKPEDALRVMSFNIRVDTPSDAADAWPRRKDLVAGLIREAAPDLLGLQEVLRPQLDTLAARLPGYAWTGRGRGREPDEGEMAVILYRTQRLRLLDSGTFWLSKRPDTPGSRYWDAAYPRIATWARLADRATGDTLVHLNTHFDHIGLFGRRWAARLVLERLERLAGGHPVVLTGDLNAQAGSAPYQILTRSAGRPLHDAFLEAARRIGPSGTYTGFGPPPEPAPRIDYVLASPSVRVLHFATLAERPGGRAPSDHRPIVADLVLPGASGRGEEAGQPERAAVQEPLGE